MNFHCVVLTPSTTAVDSEILIKLGPHSSCIQWNLVLDPLAPRKRQANKVVAPLQWGFIVW